VSNETRDPRQPGAQILVIDDEPGMREGCRRALRSVGHAVETAPDLTTARDLISKERFDVYLIDVMLPDGNGLDLLDEIYAIDPDAVCIIVTGFGRIEMAVNAVKQGAYDFLSKPFRSDELIVAVEKALERRWLKMVEAQAKELEHAKEDLEKLDRIKSQLMLKVAHELRAPAAAVQSYINLILADYVSPPEIKPTLRRVQERLQAMLDLIGDLLELARLKEPKVRAGGDKGPQDMAAILTQVHDLLREQAAEKRQNLVVEILDRPTVIADREHLVSIWTNLISNAIKYTPEGGRITVRLRADHDSLMGIVEDSGIGIAEEDLPHLFQEFFRTDEAKASGQVGTGLGLAIIKQIVESYGGQIKVTSRLGQGSRFSFILPLQPSFESPDADRLPSPARAKSADSRLPPAHTHARVIALEPDDRESEGA
jgi:two-component system, sensor histidine kinase and response regulator